MKNKDKLDRVKAIEDQQLPLNDELKILFGLITAVRDDGSDDLVATEIYQEKSLLMKQLVSEKTKLLIELGFMPQDGLIDSSIRETDLWKKIELEEVEIPVSNSRYGICTNCTEFVTISKQCKKLGVFAEEYSKLESSICPVGAW